MSHDGKTGFILLTSTYLLFDAFFGGGPDGGYQIAIYLKEIKEIKRVRRFYKEFCFFLIVFLEGKNSL